MSGPTRECVKCGKSEADLLIELKDRNCILCGATVETFVVCQPEPPRPPVSVETARRRWRKKWMPLPAVGGSPEDRASEVEDRLRRETDGLARNARVQTVITKRYSAWFARKWREHEQPDE